MATRFQGRQADQLRPYTLTPDVSIHADGSVLIEAGLTRVLCTATVEDRVPAWMQNGDRGWITAEYGMLPRSTAVRSKRDAQRQGGRTHEIQRLIGRSLRAVADLTALKGRRITLDCDVLQADGGTRCASITGAWLALALCCEKLVRSGKLSRWPLRDQVAAVSLGLVGNEILLDLDYAEDSTAQVDMNLVMTGRGEIIEVGAGGEGATFSRGHLSELMDMGELGLQPLFALQAEQATIRGLGPRLKK